MMRPAGAKPDHGTDYAADAHRYGLVRDFDFIVWALRHVPGGEGRRWCAVGSSDSLREAKDIARDRGYGVVVLPRGQRPAEQQLAG